MKFIISAIHTHTGPMCPRHGYAAKHYNNMAKGFRTLLESELPSDRKYIEPAPVSDNPEIATDEEVLALLVDCVCACVLEAWKNRAPGSCINAFGRAVVGLCRRATYSDGSAQMWGYTNTAVFEALEGGNDSGIELMYVFDEIDKLTGVRDGGLVIDDPAYETADAAYSKLAGLAYMNGWYKMHIYTAEAKTPPHGTSSPGTIPLPNCSAWSSSPTPAPWRNSPRTCAGST